MVVAHEGVTTVVAFIIVLLITSKISVAYKWVGGINLSPLRDLQVLIDSGTHFLAWHFKLHSQYVVVLIV